MWARRAGLHGGQLFHGLGVASGFVFQRLVMRGMLRSTSKVLPVLSLTLGCFVLPAPETKAVSTANNSISGKNLDASGWLNGETMPQR